jgi:hypothetical protein
MSHHKDGGWIARGILLPDLLAKRLVNRMMSPRPEQGVSEGSGQPPQDRKFVYD